MKPILEVQHIGKQFFIGGHQERYLSLRDVVANPLRKFRQPKPESFWALEDISFNIMAGDSLGIIGRNGAGKSTLLKILSKITPPSVGKIISRGRIASLLEVGTGFHPELTGMENIYMNGSILGMRKAEIDKHLEAIIDFSGVEAFLDTPLKRYSSGMQLRLAFAVAAHLEPEIIVIDEVLAVGDAEFQKKCLGKMDEVSKSGRTVLFVSHNMGAVMQLCRKGLVLQNGKTSGIVTADEAVRTYLASTSQQKEVSKDLTTGVVRKGTSDILFTRAEIKDGHENPMNSFCIGEDVTISFTVKRNNINIKTSSIVVQIKTFDELPLAHMLNADSGFTINHQDECEQFNVKIRDIRFFPGTYFVSLWCGTASGKETYDWVEGVASFDIVDGGKLTTRKLPRAAGLYLLTPEWEQKPVLN